MKALSKIFAPAKPRLVKPEAVEQHVRPVDVLGAIEVDESRTSVSIEDQPRGDGGTSPLQTDYELDIEQRNQAMVGPNGQPVDDLTYLQQLEFIQGKAAAEIAPYTNPNPASAFRAILGGQAVISPGDVPQEICRWLGANIEVRLTTIMFAPLSLPPLSLPSPLVNGARPFCRVQFGTRNGLAVVEVDVGMGGQFTVPASVVYVAVGQDAGADIPYTIAATLAFNSTRTVPVTRTRYIDGAAQGATVNLVRPAFATSLSLEVSDNNGAWTLNFKNSNGTVIYKRTVTAGNYFTAPIPLANDVVSVDVVNATTSGGGTWSGRGIFGLSL